jgi:hypothetical protein
MSFVGFLDDIPYITFLEQNLFFFIFKNFGPDSDSVNPDRKH